MFLLAAMLFVFGCDTSEPAKESQAATAVAEQVADFPLVFRRTTLIVRDVEASLALYRDALGMEVIYDNIIRRPHPTEDRERQIRLVFLKATHNFYGVLGLVDYEYQNPDAPEKPVRKEGFTPQNVVLVFNSEKLEAQFQQIRSTPGVEILTEPKLTEYPSYDGTEILRVMVSKFYDPDGFLVELNRLLDPIKPE
ncbi:MAG: VOC family protein [Acidobacteriota bacterium]